MRVAHSKAGIKLQDLGSLSSDPSLVGLSAGTIWWNSADGKQRMYIGGGLVKEFRVERLGESSSSSSSSSVV